MVPHSVTMNGAEVPFNSVDSVLNVEDLLAGLTTPPDLGELPQNSSFVGVISINGQKRTFHSREEYEKFRREMLQPLEGFGVRGPAETQLERDRKVNPFKP